jgi:hypothetical protein
MREPNQLVANTMDQDAFQNTAANEAASAFRGTGTTGRQYRIA